MERVRMRKNFVGMRVAKAMMECLFVQQIKRVRMKNERNYFLTRSLFFYHQLIKNLSAESRAETD